MRLNSTQRFLLAALAAACCSCGQRAVAPSATQPTPSPYSVGMPPPTEHWLAPDAERNNKKARKEWWRQMHRTAPGVDWAEIERSNGLALEQLRVAWKRSFKQPDGAWTERGSRNQAGRMHAVALSLDETVLYGGSARGGVWRGTLQGTGWVPLSDNLHGGAHHLAIGASPSETLTAATNGGRVRYTVDDGETWLEPAGLPPLAQVRRLFADPTDPTRIFLLADRRWPGPPNRRYAELYRSDDGGVSYVRMRRIGAVSADMWMDRVVGGDLFLLANDETWSSSDGGATWLLRGLVPTAGTVGGVVLTGSEAGAPTLYAAIDDGGWQLLRSIDAGWSWQARNVITDFWGSLAASITDADVVVTGGVETFRSGDGGASFTLVNGWGEYYADPLNKLHADVPGLDVLWTAADGEIFFIATDGGVYRSDDGVLTVQNLSMQDLGVSQYYSTHTSVNDPELILAGAQDQGYQRSFGPLAPGGQSFDQIISGDYAHITSSDGSHAWVYSVYPGFILVQEGELNPVLDFVDFPLNEQYTWLPHVLADPNDPEAFYFCASRLYRYFRDVNGDWQHVLASTQDFTAAGGYTLTALSISPVNTDIRMAVTDVGATWFSTDGGVNWSPSPDQGPAYFYLFGNSLIGSETDALTGYLGGSGYSGPGVYRTRDGGQNWEAVANGLPHTMVYDLAYDGNGSDVVYAATEAGPYRLDPATDTWEYIGGITAPLTSYFCVEAVPAAGLMRFGTYGRGIWDYAPSVQPEVDACADGIDNDLDALVDCDDPDCAADPACPEDCTNGMDDDADGAVDCADAECAADPACPESANCTDGADNDGDGLIDCADSDCSAAPECPEDCTNGLDDDGDGDVDCADSECAGIDGDGDTVPDCVDCAPADGGVVAAAPEITELRVAKAGTGVDWEVDLTWTNEAASAGAGTAHDVFSGRIDDLWSDRGFARANCRLDDHSPTSLRDDWPLTGAVRGTWYLVRADNTCGAGSFGLGAFGPRTLPPSPCD